MIYLFSYGVMVLGAVIWFVYPLRKRVSGTGSDNTLGLTTRVKRLEERLDRAMSLNKFGDR